MVIQSKSIFSFLLLCFFTTHLYAQIDTTSIRIPQLLALQNNQSLVSRAIDGAVYLVRQEYVLESPSGEHLGRGILNHFGKSYRIGVLVERDLWIPSSTITPWTSDPNFTEYKDEYSPLLSYTKIKRINTEKDYRPFETKDIKIDSEGLLTSFKPGIVGLQASDSLPSNGKLLVYFVEGSNGPDEAEIKSSTINLKKIEWDSHGKAEVSDVRFKDRTILGGAMFTERVAIGLISIELVAIYTDKEGNWSLQAVSPLLVQNN